MACSSTVKVLIDLTKTEVGLELEELESLTRNLAEELSELAEDVHLLRQSKIPEGGKPGLAAFVIGVLQAEVSVKNLKTLMDFLGERFYGKSLKLEFTTNGKSYKLEYCSRQQLQDAVQAIERLAQLA